MSGLFYTLSARFMPGTLPAIRPRPQLRFEGGANAEGLREESAERIARAPRSPEPVSRANSPPAAPQQTLPAPPAGVKEAPPETPPAPVAQRTEGAREAPDRPAETSRAPDAPKPEKKETRSNNLAPIPLQTAQPQSSDRLSVVSPPPPTNPALPAERIIETAVPRPVPQLDHRPDPQSIRPAPEASPAPVRQPETPIIRIGRIEVSRPAPPAPPPQPPAPARPEPPRRAAAAPRVKPPSGLTDYLGWKKR